MKYKAVFLKKYGDNEFIKIGNKKFSEKDNKIDWENHIFVIPKKTFSFQDKNELILFFDVDNDKFLGFKEIDLGYDSKFLHQLIANNAIGKLIQKLGQSMQEEKSKFAWISTIAVFVIGAVIGYLLHGGI